MKRLAVVLAGLIVPLACAAQASDLALGREWATCAKETEIRGKFLDDEAQKDRHRKLKSILMVYALAAAGPEEAYRTAEAVEIRFSQGLAPGDPQRTKAFMQSFFKQAEVHFKRCGESMAANDQRMKPRVREMIKKQD